MLAFFVECVHASLLIWRTGIVYFIQVPSRACNLPVIGDPGDLWD